MNDRNDKPLLGFGYSLGDTLEVYKVFLKRLCELTIEEMARDLSSEPPPNVFNELAISAYLLELHEKVVEAVSIPKSYRPIDKSKDWTYKDWNYHFRLAAKHFPAHADLFRSLLVPQEMLELSEEANAPLKTDVSERLASMKRRVGDRFVREFRSEVMDHGITSPVEQIFLME